MPENQEINEELPHFSRNILLFALLFLLVNAAGMGLLFAYDSANSANQEIAPKLLFAKSQTVLTKTLFETDFSAALQNQFIHSGTAVQTGDQSFAELQLQGNILRLDQNTTVILKENRGETPEGEGNSPRLTFELSKGRVWVKAHDPVTVQTPFSALRFAESLGSFKVEESMNRIAIVSGGAELILKDSEDQSSLARFFIPLGHQISFSNAQITPSYRLLQSSKLKKELHLARLADSELQDPWVRQNLNSAPALGTFNPFSSSFLYSLKERYYTWRQKFAFNPNQERDLELARLEHQLNHWLAGTSPASLESLNESLREDPRVLPLLQQAFYRTGFPPFDSNLFSLKERLRGFLMDSALNPALFLRTYLTDMEWAAREHQSDLVLYYAKSWSEAWSQESAPEAWAELENQSQLFYNLAQLAPELLGDPVFHDLLKTIAEKRLRGTPGRAETLFTLTEETLELAGVLIEKDRALLAGQFLDQAEIFLKDPSLASETGAYQIFLTRVEFLNEKIAFIEEELHGSASSFEEGRFRRYLERKLRDQKLSEDLASLLKDDSAALMPDPTFEEVMQRMAQARISVIADDIEVSPDSPFQFIIHNALLLDRAADGSSLVFRALYDFSTNAVQDIEVNGRMMRGHFELKDLVSILTHPDFETVSSFPLDELLKEEDNAETEARGEVVSQKLALELVFEALKDAGLPLKDSRKIQIVDELTLEDFIITEMPFPLPGNSRKTLHLSFNFNLPRQQASSIHVLEKPIYFPEFIPLVDLAETVRVLLLDSGNL